VIAFLLVCVVVGQTGAALLKPSDAQNSSAPTAGAAENPPLTTTLKGQVSDSSGRDYQVDVEVTSTVSKDAPHEICYSLLNKSDATLEIAGKAKDAKAGLRLVWESVESPAFYDAIRTAKATSIVSGGKPTKVRTKGKTFEISRKLLMIKDGNDTLLAITAPAYRTKD
jgi:hypothetical protein